MDSLDNYKMLSERMNVLTIYLPWGKLPVASNLRIVKTAVHVCIVDLLSRFLPLNLVGRNTQEKLLLTCGTVQLCAAAAIR